MVQCAVPKNIQTCPWMVTGNTQWMMALSAKILVKVCITEAKLEFPDGWGSNQNPFMWGGGGMDIFWNQTIWFGM